MQAIIDSPITIGDNNIVSVIHNEKDNIDWEELKEECLFAIQHLPSDVRERQVAEELFVDSVNKDSHKLRNTFKKYAAELSSKLFSGVAGAVLTELIKSFVIK